VAQVRHDVPRHIGQEATLAAIEAGGLTVESADVVDGGEDELFLWIFARRNI
jgi:hypothetical protein